MKKVYLLLFILTFSSLFLLYCGKQKPQNYGMFFYKGNKLIEFERAQWSQVRSKKNWVNYWCPELALPFSEKFISKISDLDDNRPQFVIYFNKLKPSDIHITKAECDLVLTSISYREEVIRRRERPWVGTPIYDEGPIPVAGALYKYRKKIRNSTYILSMNHFILNAIADKYIYREGFNKGTELVISPLEGIADAYLVSPKKNINTGVYLIYIGGESSKETQKKGATYFSIGTLDSLEIMQENDIKTSCDKLKTILVNKTMQIGPCK